MSHPDHRTAIDKLIATSTFDGDEQLPGACAETWGPFRCDLPADHAGPHAQRQDGAVISWALSGDLNPTRRAVMSILARHMPANYPETPQGLVDLVNESAAVLAALHAGASVSDVLLEKDALPYFPNDGEDPDLDRMLVELAALVTP